jgi:hypothetical protein
MGRRNTNPARPRLKCRQCGELCHIGKTICHQCNKQRKAQANAPLRRISKIEPMGIYEYEEMQEARAYREKEELW